MLTKIYCSYKGLRISNSVLREKKARRREANIWGPQILLFSKKKKFKLTLPNMFQLQLKKNFGDLTFLVVLIQNLILISLVLEGK